jgi:hypothetical protein
MARAYRLRLCSCADGHTDPVADHGHADRQRCALAGSHAAGSAAQYTRPMAAAGAVEAVAFETASGAPWAWSCASCPSVGCAITAPSNTGSASSASTPPRLVSTVPAALGDLWCIGRITSMCARSHRFLSLQPTVSADSCRDLSAQNLTGQLPAAITRLRLLSSMCARVDSQWDPHAMPKRSPL